MQDKLLTPWNAEQWLWLFQQPYCDYHMLRKQTGLCLYGAGNHERFL